MRGGKKGREACANMSVCPALLVPCVFFKYLELRPILLAPYIL